ncbi:MAG: hypothetical protein KatS3mg050_3659 [Litorilinea sp.]|uniref:non-specific serine/threonine protein kinase n=2 Tax=Litorilinea aerophila TaxID=1204385 RepID=A0A540VM91_9CHLR|nr:MAG: hypothetical protein KatS3mg050_3659 [Litorilinea sp.]
MDLSGQQIGRYLIRQRLGQGGVATVYQAYDQVLGRSVALKILLPHADDKAQSRFRREALMAGTLRHPHIVRILQVGNASQGSVAYIAMELVEGESLSSLLARHGRLLPEESCNLLEPIARALAYAHRAGIVHRDVKPSNILLRIASPGTPNSVQLESLDHPVVPLLTDFGVARALDAPELTSTGRTVGTPAFMAPEQCSGRRDVDGRADIYSLGTVLYRCVTGRLPFTGSTTQILHAHVYEPLTIDAAVYQHLPPLLVEILRKSLAKRPEDRYPDADAMADALMQVAGRRPRPVGPAADGATATATLTLSGLTPAVSQPAAQEMAVLIPAPGDQTPPSVTSTPPPRPPQPRAGRLATFSWPRLALAGILFLLAVLAGLTLASGPNGSPLARLTGRVDASSTPAVAVIPRELPLPPPSATPTPAAGSAKPFGPPAQGGVGSGPRATLVTSPLATSVSTATPRPVPTDTPTVAPTWTPAATPTADRPEGPPPQPQAAPSEGLVGTCATVIDPFFLHVVSALDESIRPQFLCPNGPALATNGEIWRFEYGFMLHLDETPLIYVYYDLTQEWEQVVNTWREGDPVVTGVVEPPASNLYQPERGFGRVWEEHQRQVSLGFATTAAPTPFAAIMQSFPGGILIGNRDDGAVYLFLRSKLRL